MSEFTSQYAINDYIHVEGNFYIHETKVIVIKNNHIIYDGILKVRAHIESNDSIVDIIWDNEEEKKFYCSYNGKYENTDIEFDDGKLVIQAVDRNNIPISITVY